MTVKFHREMEISLRAQVLHLKIKIFNSFRAYETTATNLAIPCLD